MELWEEPWAGIGAGAAASGWRRRPRRYQQEEEEECTKQLRRNGQGTFIQSSLVQCSSQGSRAQESLQSQADESSKASGDPSHLCLLCLSQGLLPRGEKPNPLRQKNAKVNQLLKVSLPKLANVQLLDIDGGFVHSDGAISCHDMFDFLHLTGGGYAKVCKPLHELIMQLLEETPEEKQTTIA